MSIMKKNMSGMWYLTQKNIFIYSKILTISGRQKIKPVYHLVNRLINFKLLNSIASKFILRSFNEVGSSS